METLAETVILLDESVCPLYSLSVIEINILLPQVLGTSIDAIKCTEDRQLFAEKLKCIGENVAFGKAACSVEEVGIHKYSNNARNNLYGAQLI